MAYDTDTTDTLTLTAEIVASYLGNASHVKADDIPALIRSVRAALEEHDAPVSPAVEDATPKATPAQIRKSITPDALISFVDGKPYKTLKRHLSTRGMSHNEYKARYGLPQDYPSVAPAYSAARSDMAKKLGLGARRKAPAAEPAKRLAPVRERKRNAPAASSAPEAAE